MTAAKAAAKDAKNAPVKAEKKAAPATKKTTAPKNAPVAHGVGRRKASVARVWLRKNGKGQVTVNQRSFEEYFNTIEARKAALLPMKVVPAASGYDVEVNVSGGGITGQADAIKLGIARALVSIDEELRALLREHDLLTVDARVVERKKPGQRGARRKFQFVKR